MATILSLRKALESATSSFRTLQDIVWDKAPIVRSKHFAECRVLIAGKPALLSMPLTPMALQHIEAIAPHKPYLGSEIVPHIKLLRDEMRYFDATGSLRTSDIVIEPLCEGISFATAVAEAKSSPAQVSILLAAVDRLEQQLAKADISHNNLKEENLILDNNNNLRPIRWHYATVGGGGDTLSIEKLRTKIAALSCDGLLCEPEGDPYMVEEYDVSAYRNTLGMAEGMIAVETDNGWGFIDCCGRVVIPPQYHWVSKFNESRAEVETSNGMGLIDKSGRYIISPDYCIVDYDPVTGHSMVNDGSSWAEFDYSGNIITEWGEAEPEI